jgi:hypothetical protein
MLTVPPPQFRPNRRAPKAKAAARPPVPVALTLVAASYDSVALTLLLTFDRAIDISGMDGSQISVDDQVEGNRFLAEGSPTMSDPQSVLIELTYVGPASGSLVLLNAAAGNGIVAVDDGGAWAGVVDWVLGT